MSVFDLWLRFGVIDNILERFEFIFLLLEEILLGKDMEGVDKRW